MAKGNYGYAAAFNYFIQNISSPYSEAEKSGICSCRAAFSAIKKPNARAAHNCARRGLQNCNQNAFLTDDFKFSAGRRNYFRKIVFKLFFGNGNAFKGNFIARVEHC